MSAGRNGRGREKLMPRTQTSESFRVGLIGAGAIARFHAQALRKLPGVAIAAVCDRDQGRATSLQQAFGVPHVFSSVAEMSRVDLDAVHVLVPPVAHAATTIDCLERGWHVLVEKPFATTPQECRDIEAAAQRTGRSVGVNHNVTFLPAFLRLIGDIRARKFGRIENVHVCYNLPMPQLAIGQHGHWMFAEAGNIVLELGPHPMSALVRLMGPVESAVTVVSGGRTLKHGGVFFDNWQTLLTCERGTAQCYLSVGGNFADGWLYVVGQDASGMVDLIRNTYMFSTKTRFIPPVENLADSFGRSRAYLADGFRNITTYARGVLGLSDTSDAFSVGMKNSVAAFYEALGRGTPPPVGAAEGTAVIDACQSVIDSIRQGERHHVKN